jgi:hypothetical protein
MKCVFHGSIQARIGLELDQYTLLGPCVHISFGLHFLVDKLLCSSADLGFVCLTCQRKKLSSVSTNFTNFVLN